MKCIRTMRVWKLNSIGRHNLLIPLAFLLHAGNYLSMHGSGFIFKCTFVILIILHHINFGVLPRRPTLHLNKVYQKVLGLHPDELRLFSKHPVFMPSTSIYIFAFEFSQVQKQRFSRY